MYNLQHQVSFNSSRKQFSGLEGRFRLWHSHVFAMSDIDAEEPVVVEEEEEEEITDLISAIKKATFDAGYGSF